MIEDYSTTQVSQLNPAYTINRGEVLKLESALNAL